MTPHDTRTQYTLPITDFVFVAIVTVTLKPQKPSSASQGLNLSAALAQLTKFPSEELTP